jgi:hypothetical protein
MVSSRAEDAEVGDARRAGEEEADPDFFFGRRKRRRPFYLCITKSLFLTCEKKCFSKII